MLILLLSSLCNRDNTILPLIGTLLASTFALVLHFVNFGFFYHQFHLRAQANKSKLWYQMTCLFVYAFAFHMLCKPFALFNLLIPSELCIPWHVELVLMFWLSRMDLINFIYSLMKLKLILSQSHIKNAFTFLDSFLNQTLRLTQQKELNQNDT